MGVVNHEQAALMFRLYDLRRERRLREACAWFMNEFKADNLEEFLKRCPPGSREEASFRMATTYWEMCASLVNRGLIDEDLYFENTRDQWGVWSRLEPLIAGIRALMKDPLFYSNLERHALRYREWAERRSPGSSKGVFDFWEMRRKAIEAGRSGT
jgi:hypothetical protein